jgi:hypothetical protein
VSDLIDGKLNGWPVSLMIQRDAGGKVFGLHCAAYTKDDKEPPTEISDLAYDITDACDGLTPAKAIKKAVSLGFVPDTEE